MKITKENLLNLLKEEFEKGGVVLTEEEMKSIGDKLASERDKNQALTKNNFQQILAEAIASSPSYKDVIQKKQEDMFDNLQEDINKKIGEMHIRLDNTEEVTTIEKRKLNELDDLIINGKLSIQELYDFAKENDLMDANLYFVSKKEGGSMSDTIYTQNVTHFGRGWSKKTIMIHTSYKKDEEIDTCKG